MSGTPPVALAAHFTRADLVMVVLIFVLIAFAANLALAETALSRMSRVKAMALEEEGRHGAQRLRRLVQSPEQFFNIILLLLLVCHTVAATMLGIVTEKYGFWGVAGATTFEVAFIFVFAEAMPKTWAIQHTDAAALRSSAYIAPIVRFWPLRMISTGLIKLSNVLLPGKGLPLGPSTSEEEILATTDVAAGEGVIEREERTLIHSIIAFGDTVTREVMVPRTDMVAVEGRTSVADALEVALTAGYSRIPAYEQGIDDVLGLVFLKDLVRAHQDGRGDEAVRSLVREAKVVPETKRVAELMREMQVGKNHMAVVVDEYGGVAGVVTLEDLIEELVGEITDEYDVDEAKVERLADGSFRVQASCPIDELNEDLHLGLPEADDWDSVGGLILHLLGHVPEPGEVARTERFAITVEEVQGNRIGRVHIEQLPEASHAVLRRDVADPAHS